MNTPIKGRVFLHSVHASLEYDMAQIFQALGMTIGRANMNRTHEERPCIEGYTDMDYGDEIRGRVDRKECVESDFDGCDLIFFFNPSDFHHRMAHFSKFRPSVMYLNGQWVEHQMDELAGVLNGQWDRREQCNIWVAVYTKVEEDYLRARTHTQLQERIHHIRFAKKASDYLTTDGTDNTDGKRKDWIYTTCNDIHNRPKACNWEEWKQISGDLPHRLSGRNTDQVGGQGLVSWDQLRWNYRHCGAYLGVPCWPAPLVLNIVEAMMSGAPVAYWDNHRGIAQEGIFDGVGCLSDRVPVIKEFLHRCLSDKGFQKEQSELSLARAKEFFDFEQQVAKWRVLFEQMAELWT